MTTKEAPKNHRTLVALVEDKPGVLNRIASLFRRRNFNIESLNVSRTHEPGVSRMTIVVDATAEVAVRIQANLYKLVNVLRVDDITEAGRVTRNLALIKIKAEVEHHPQIASICEIFRARLVDVGVDSMMLEITDTEEKITALLAALAPFEIIEVAQTGAVSMAKGPRQHSLANAA